MNYTLGLSRGGGGYGVDYVVTQRKIHDHYHRVKSDNRKNIFTTFSMNFEPEGLYRSKAIDFVLFAVPCI